MDETNIISPEVKGLFDKVRSQALEFSKAFEYFDSQRKELERIKLDFLELFRQYRIKVDTSLEEIKKNSQDSIDSIELKSEKILQIYEDIHNINKLKEQLSELYDKTSLQSMELENQINKIKTRNGNLFDDNIKQSIENELNSFSQKFELKLGLKIKQVESKFITFNQKIWALVENQSREYKQFIDEIDEIKSQANKLRKANLDLQLSISKEHDEANSVIKSKLEKLDLMIADFENIKSEMNPTNLMTKGIFSDHINALNNRLKKYEDSIWKLEKRNKITIYLATVSILIAIIAILIIIF